MVGVGGGGEMKSKSLGEGKLFGCQCKVGGWCTGEKVLRRYGGITTHLLSPHTCVCSSTVQLSW